jgi:hypothetical protein
MEHIPAIHAAKVGMRYPARVVSVGLRVVTVELDLTLVAPGRDSRLAASLDVDRTVTAYRARELREGDRVDVVLIEKRFTWGVSAELRASLPADPAWLTWNNGTVRQLALRISDSGETVLLPVLADALEEAGCTERELLTWCRQPDGDALDWLVTLLATQE